MDFSSDDSFAWRTDSEESTDGEREDMVTHAEKIVENGSESQYFEKTSKSERRAKKRKNKGDIESPIRKKVKTEQESDIENKSVENILTSDDDNYLPVKPKKTKSVNGNKKKYNLSNDELDDDEYLSMKADQENDSEQVKPKMSKLNNEHKKKFKSIDDVTDDDRKYLTGKAKEEKLNSKESKLTQGRKKKKSVCDEMDDDENYLAIKAKEESFSSEEVILKKSKKVKTKKNKSLDEVVDEDEDYLTMKAKQEELDCEEVEEKPKKKKKKRSKELVIENNCVEETNGTHRSDDGEFFSHDALNTHDNTFRSNHQDESFVRTEQSEVDQSKITTSSVNEENNNLKKYESSVDKSSPAQKIVKRPRMSDRIIFEEDVETPPTNDEDNMDATKRRRHFLKENPNLNPIVIKSDAPIISEDDEIWVLKCPNEMNVSGLSGQEINLSSQCKIKMDGDSYIGTVQSEPIRIALMTFEKNRSVIKNQLCKGSINFRKRIPKLHIQDDRSVYQNPSHFIPLPETKIRHPLFGSDYKKAIKVHKQVAQKLKPGLDDSMLLHKERKKKKKRERELEETLTELTESMQTEPEADFIRKKTKKERRKERKYTEETEPPQKTNKSKKSKHNRDSLEVWESEKKIEESLFNF